MNQFTVFEGVDGAGKTCVSKGLARDHDGFYIKTPGDQYKPVRGFIDAQASPLARLLFYFSSVADASQKVGTMLGERSVMCDRYMWSTLVTHAAYYGEDLGKLERLWKPVTDRIIKPHQTVLLKVSEEEQLRRLHGEDRALPLSASDRFCLDATKRKRVHALYEEVADRFGWLKIDTTGRTVESVVEELNDRCFQRQQLVA